MNNKDQLLDFEERATKANTDQQLAEIMTDMESYYGIPALNGKRLEEINEEIIKLYKRISGMRSL